MKKQVGGCALANCDLALEQVPALPVTTVKFLSLALAMGDTNLIDVVETLHRRWYTDPGPSRVNIIILTG